MAPTRQSASPSPFFITYSFNRPSPAHLCHIGEGQGVGAASGRPFLFPIPGLRTHLPWKGRQGEKRIPTGSDLHAGRTPPPAEIQ